MNISFKIFVVLSTIVISEATANAHHGRHPQEFYSPDKWKRSELEQSQVFPQKLKSNPFRSYQRPSFNPNINNPGQRFDIYQQKPIRYPSFQPPPLTSNTYRSDVAAPFTSSQNQSGSIVTSGGFTPFKIIHIPLALGSQRDQIIKLPISDELTSFRVVHISPSADGSDGSSGISSHELKSLGSKDSDLSKTQSFFTPVFTEIDYNRGKQPILQQSNRHENQGMESSYITNYNHQNYRNQVPPANHYSSFKAASNAKRSFGNGEAVYNGDDFSFRKYSSPGCKNNDLKSNQQNTSYGATQATASATSRFEDKGTAFSSSHSNSQNYEIKSAALDNAFSNSKASASTASSFGNQGRTINSVDLYSTKNYPRYRNYRAAFNKKDTNLGATEATASAIRKYGDQNSVIGSHNSYNIRIYPKNNGNQALTLGYSDSKGALSAKKYFINQGGAYNDADIYLTKRSPGYRSHGAAFYQQYTNRGDIAQYPATVMSNSESQSSKHNRRHSFNANNNPSNQNQGMIQATSFSDSKARSIAASSFGKQDRERNVADIHSTNYYPGYSNYGVAPYQRTTEQDKSYGASQAIVSTKSIYENQGIEYSSRNSSNPKKSGNQFDPNQIDVGNLYSPNDKYQNDSKKIDNTWKYSGNQVIDQISSDPYPANGSNIKKSRNQDLDLNIVKHYPINDNNWKDSVNKDVDLNFGYIANEDNLKDSTNKDLYYPVSDNPNFANDDYLKESENRHVDHNTSNPDPANENNFNDSKNQDIDPNIHNLSPVKDDSLKDGRNQKAHSDIDILNPATDTDSPLIGSSQNLNKTCSSPQSHKKDELVFKPPNIRSNESKTNVLTNNSSDSSHNRATNEDDTRETTDDDSQPTYALSNDECNSTLEPKPDSNFSSLTSSNETENLVPSIGTLHGLTSNDGSKNSDSTETTLDGPLSDNYVHNTSKKSEENEDSKTNVDENKSIIQHQKFFDDLQHVSQRPYHNSPTKHSKNNSHYSASNRPASKLLTFGGIHEAHPKNSENTQSTNKSASSVVHSGYPEITQLQPANSLNASSHDQHKSTKNPLEAVKDEYNSEPPNSQNYDGSSGPSSNPTNSSYSASFDDGTQQKPRPINETYVLIKNESSSSLSSKLDSNNKYNDDYNYKSDTATQSYLTATVSRDKISNSAADNKSNTSHTSHSQAPYHDVPLKDDSSKDYSTKDIDYLHTKPITSAPRNIIDENDDNNNNATGSSLPDDSETFTTIPGADSTGLTSKVPSLLSKTKKRTLTSLLNSWLADNIKQKSSATLAQTTNKHIAGSNGGYNNSSGDVLSDSGSSDRQAYYGRDRSKANKRDTFINAQDSVVGKDKERNRAAATSSETWNTDQSEGSAVQETKTSTSKTSTSGSNSKNETAGNSHEIDFDNFLQSDALRILVKIIASIEKLLKGDDEDKNVN